jgi:putative hydrolase of the HAD superfamily
MRKDILPARRAGFQTVLFAGDARSLRMGADAPQAETLPDLIVTELSQLISWLGK